MGMAASSLRFAQLTARKNQVEFEGQQINQQRLTLSQKSTALFNDMLTKQVPTAPDPSAFTRIVYKFNSGFGESSILNLARKSSGAYNYNVTYKRPKTTKTLSRSSFSNIGFTTTLGVTTSDKSQALASNYARTANVDGVSRNLTLVGGNSAAAKLQTYRDKLETYNNMKTIEEQIRSLSNKNGADACESSTQQNIKSALGLKYDASGDGQNKISEALKTIADKIPDDQSSVVGSSEPPQYKEAYYDDFSSDRAPAKWVNTEIRTSPKPPSWHSEFKTKPTLDPVVLGAYPTISTPPTDEEKKKAAAYNMAVALGISSSAALSEDLTKVDMVGALNDILSEEESPMNTWLRNKLTGSPDGTNLATSFNFQDGAIKKNDIYKKESGEDATGVFKSLFEFERKELANLLARYANGNANPLTDDQKMTDDKYTQASANQEYSKEPQLYFNYEAKLAYDNANDEEKQKCNAYDAYLGNQDAWKNYHEWINNQTGYLNERASESLIKVAKGKTGYDGITNDQMVEMLNELLKTVGENCTSSGDYKTTKVDPAFAQYQSATATAGIVNIAAGQILYEYQDDDGQKCYMYVSNENVLDDTSSTYAEQVSVYENVLNYLEGEMETESQDANVIMSDEGQVAKITFADGTVVTPEVVTEMDNDAYNQAMVEYEYKKDVYDKEMNDCNAKVKIIQAQDQKLEVRLKQLDTEQKALSTEIEALKSIRDKAIESSFKTFS